MQVAPISGKIGELDKKVLVDWEKKWNNSEDKEVKYVYVEYGRWTSGKNYYGYLD